VNRRERAIRRGDWKLLNAADRVELYDLKNDPSETKNLAELEPERVAELRKFMEQAAANDLDSEVPKEPR